MTQFSYANNKMPIAKVNDRKNHVYFCNRHSQILENAEKTLGKVDVLITEGTTFSRGKTAPITEEDLQNKVREYAGEYKYVFILAASTNLERICACSDATPSGKYFSATSFKVV